MNQATLLRKLNGKKRLEQALLLSDLVRELALKNIVKQAGGKNSIKKARLKLWERLTIASV